MARVYRVHVWARGEAPPSPPEFTIPLGELEHIPTIGGHPVHPVRGTTESQPYTLPVLGDAIASRFGDAGRAAMLGRVVRLEEQIDGGGWVTVDTGRCGDLGESSGPGKIDLEAWDERWVERRAEIFGHTTTVQLHPFGLTVPFGRPGFSWRVDDAGYDETMEVVDVDGDAVRIRTGGAALSRAPREIGTTLLSDLLDPGRWSMAPGNVDGNFRSLRLDVSAVSQGGLPQEGLRVIALGGDSLGGTPTEQRMLGPMHPGQSGLPDQPDHLPGVSYVWVHWPSHELTVGAELTARLHFPGLGVPVSDQVPLHVGGADGIHLGQLILKVVDGVYDGAPVRVQASSRAWLESADLPRVWLRRTEKAKRGEWLGSNTYAWLLLVAFADVEEGIRYRRLSRPSVDPDTLPMLDLTNVATGWRWRNSGREVYNRVVGEFGRLVRDASGPLLDRLKFDRLTRDQDHDTTEELGTKELTLSTELVFEPGAEGHILAWLAEEIFDLYGDGAIVRTITAEAISLDVQPGDLVRVDMADLKMPNPATNDRTGTRVCWVLGRRRSPVSQELDLLDLGPSVQPPAAPDVSIAQGAEPSQVEVDLDLLPTATAEVEVTHAPTDAQPPDDAWRIPDAGVQSGTHTYRLDESAGFAHVRARQRLPNGFPSEWAYASVALSARPIAHALELDLERREVRWRVNGDTAGVRLRFSVHAEGEDPVYGDPVDFAAGASPVPIPESVELVGRADVAVELVPYPEFSGGSVSGTPGQAVTACAVWAPQAESPTANLREIAPTDRTTARFELTGRVGPGGRPPLGYAYQITRQGEDPVVEFGEPVEFPEPVDGVYTAILDLTRHITRPRVLAVRVTDADGREVVITHPIAPAIDVGDSVGRGGSHGERELDRRGLPGLPGRRLDSTDTITDDGTERLIDTETRRLRAPLSMPDGMPVTDAEDGAGRARGGLTEAGVVDLDVPRGRAAANLPAVSPSSGRLRGTEPIDGSETDLPVSTGDPVSALTDGAVVTSNAAAGKGASDDLDAIPEIDRSTQRVTGFQGEGGLARKSSVDLSTSEVTNKSTAHLTDTTDKRLVTDSQRTGATRAANALNSSDRLITGTTNKTVANIETGVDAGNTAAGKLENRTKTQIESVIGTDNRAKNLDLASIGGGSKLAPPNINDGNLPGGVKRSDGGDIESVPGAQGKADAAQTGAEASAAAWDELIRDDAYREARRRAHDATGRGGSVMERVRSREGQTGLPGRTKDSRAIVTRDGVSALTDPDEDKLLAGWKLPAGQAISTTETGAGRANTGLDEAGKVRLDVPRDRAIAEIDAISKGAGTEGKLDPTVPTASGENVVETNDSIVLLTGRTLANIDDTATRKAIAGDYVDESNRPTTLRRPASDLTADDAVAAGESITRLSGRLTSNLTDDADLGKTAEWPSVSGEGKPEDNATVGARIGTDLKREDGTTDATEADLITALGTAGDTAQVGGTAAGTVRDNAEDGKEGRRRVDTLRSSDGVLKSSVVQTDGVAQRVLAKGHVAGAGWVHGDPVTFPVAFENPPMILLRGGLTFHPDLSTVAHARDVVPENVTAAGFELRAMIVAKGVQTNHTHNFPSGTLTAQGHTLAVALDPGGASGNAYDVRYAYSLENNADSLEVVVAIDTNDGGGWVERATRAYILAPSESQNGNETVPIVVSGLGLNDEIQVRLKTVTVEGTGVTTVSIDPTDVQYATSSDDEKNATPAGYTVSYEAMAVS